MTNYEEFMLGTNPNLADTDGDGPNDKWELEHGFSPKAPALPPVLPDTDGDGVADIWETRLGTDPLSVATNWPCADTDGDGFTNEYEIRYLLSDAFDSSRPEWPDTDEAGVLTCSIASDQPCWLVFRYNDDPIGTNEVRIAWVPGISPSSVNLLVDAARPASVALARGDTGGYWSCSLDVDGYGAFFTEKNTSSDEGWFTPDATAGEGWSVDLWRLGSPSLDFDFCGLTDHAEIYLTSLAHYGGTVSWSSCPEGISGIGNPLVFNPSEVAPGTYELTASVQATTGTAEGHYTVHIRALHVQTASLLVDATDTTTHRLPVDDATSFIPDGEDYYIYSEPEGIDSIEFVPADLTPGQRYTVYIWNGDCGYATVTIDNFAIVSETEAEWPENRARTEVGVGEIVNMSVQPSVSGVTWACDSAKGIIVANGASAVLNVRDVAGTLIVSATAGGISLAKTFTVFEPAGVVNATVFQLLPLYSGVSRACATLNVTLGPTNVNFYKIYVREGICQATGVTGWFAAYPSRHPAHEGSHAVGEEDGDVQPVLFDDGHGNIFRDNIDSGEQSPEGTAWNPYWYGGSMKWDIPAFWWLERDDFGNRITHEFSSLWTEAFQIDSHGTVSVAKFGLTVTRTTSNDVTVSPSSNGGSQ